MTPRKKTQFIRKNFIKNKIQESNRKAKLKIVLEQNFQPQRTLVIKKYLMLKAKSKARRKIIPAKGWGSTVPKKIKEENKQIAGEYHRYLLILYSK